MVFCNSANQVCWMESHSIPTITWSVWRKRKLMILWQILGLLWLIFFFSITEVLRGCHLAENRQHPIILFNEGHMGWLKCEQATLYSLSLPVSIEGMWSWTYSWPFCPLYWPTGWAGQSSGPAGSLDSLLGSCWCHRHQTEALGPTLKGGPGKSINKQKKW